jgi:DNA-directed RNA polymerase specialized sigma24 family protein
MRFRHKPELLAFFWRATHRADLAADLTAEVFAQARGSTPNRLRRDASAIPGATCRT